MQNIIFKKIIKLLCLYVSYTCIDFRCWNKTFSVDNSHPTHSHIRLTRNAKICFMQNTHRIGCSLAESAVYKGALFPRGIVCWAIECIALWLFNVCLALFQFPIQFGIVYAFRSGGQNCIMHVRCNCDALYAEIIRYASLSHGTLRWI